MFKGFEDVDSGEGNPANETSNEMSRTSSGNEKKKLRKPRNTDDSFEARSQYNAYYPTMQQTAQVFDQGQAAPNYLNPYVQQPMMDQSGIYNPAYQDHNANRGYQAMPNPWVYPTDMPQYQVMNSSNMNGQSFNQQSQAAYYPQIPQIAPPYYQPMQPYGALGQRSSPAMSSPALSHNTTLSRPHSQMSNHQWTPNSYGYPYQQPSNQKQFYQAQMFDQQPPMSVPPLSMLPYQFGQLPYSPNPQSARLQHPVPGSYQRPNFNPQTKAFVPTSVQPPNSIPLTERTNGANVCVQAVGMQNGSQGSQYGMPSYGQPLSIPAPSAFSPAQDTRPHNSRKDSSQTNGVQQPSQSTLSKWGTPANLPPKPPPPEPSTPEGQRALPANAHAPIHIQTMSAGQPLPTYQNGVYSMPTSQ